MQKIGQPTIEISTLPELQYELPLKATLRPYQEQGIARGMELRRVMIGDEQGLGKTLQSIGTVVGIEAALKQNAFPCLVICPSSTKINWKREWEKFSNKKAMVLDDKSKNTWHQYWNIGMIDVFIVNYESLKKFFVLSMPEVKKGQPFRSTDIQMKSTIDLFKSVIVDESQRCKDATTLQSKLVLRICHQKENVICLSGTPVVNKPADLFPQLAIMGHAGTFGGKKHFLDRYCEGGRGANNLKELNFLLNKHCFFRREKKDVAKDLPEKTRRGIICDITNRDEYDRMRVNAERELAAMGLSLEDIKSFKNAEAIQLVMKLMAISAKGKIEAAKEYIDSVVECGEKIIVFCRTIETVSTLKKIYPKAVTVTGSDDMQTRQKHIDSFQNDPNCLVIIVNHKAGGVGITLTAASREVFVEWPWTYSDCVQCEDRAHRIGQKNNVDVAYLIGKDTVDEDRYEAVMEKMHIGNTITGATDRMEMEMIDKTSNLFNS
ncbi:DEAD/DEAH box helicase [Chitinophaga sp. Hz27]|uniref:DEAD/DEAH box helicase n=1 Tax=Chitinophaga sp. Hz27 TaxID=3347169 RepID=UPI0035DC83BA